MTRNSLEEGKADESETRQAEDWLEYDLVASVFHIADSHTSGNVVAVIKVRM